MLERLERFGGVVCSVKVEVELEKSEEFGASGLMCGVGEAVGVFEDTTANHKTVERGIFLGKLHGGGAVFDVAVDEELGFWGVSVAEVDDFWNKLVVSGNFGHFFARA